jgi:hypothetical protein
LIALEISKPRWFNPAGFFVAKKCLPGLGNGVELKLVAETENREFSMEKPSPSTRRRARLGAFSPKALRGASSWGATSSRLSVAGSAKETQNYENNNPKSNGGAVYCRITSNPRARHAGL